MTPDERLDRARRAKEALDGFLGPALDRCRDDYLAALTTIAANEPWETGKMSKLAIAMKVIDMVGQQVRAEVELGADARREVDRAQKIAALPEAKRKWALR